MKNLLTITLLLLSNLIFSQDGYYDNEKKIENIEKYNKEEVEVEIDNEIKIDETNVLKLFKNFKYISEDQ